MPATKKPAGAPGAKPAKPADRPAKPTHPTLTTLTANEVDAVLRDPNCPPDVRATIADRHAANEYLRGVKFNVNKDDGYTTVVPPDNA